MFRKSLLLAVGLALAGAFGSASAEAQDKVVIKQRGGPEYHRGVTKKVVIHKRGDRGWRGDRGYHRGHTKKVIIKHRGYGGGSSKKVIIKQRMD
jgi:hypothetical protein